MSNVLASEAFISKILVSKITKFIILWALVKYKTYDFLNSQGEIERFAHKHFCVRILSVVAPKAAC